MVGPGLCLAAVELQGLDGTDMTKTTDTHATEAALSAREDVRHGGMRLLPGGAFHMGSDRFYPEERPMRQVRVGAFWIDETPITNRQFGAFVEATNYVTVAEQPLDPKAYPGVPPENLKPGSLVFQKTAGPVDLRDFSKWWSFRFGASWRHPLGPDSSIEGIEDHPVVQVCWKDADAYARWAGKVLPTEAEWEFAARGGLDRAEYAWGDELAPEGRMLANFWQGDFPYSNDLSDGWERTSPVGYYPPNGYGLSDVIGNVWEWTNDWWTLPSVQRKAPGSCCIPSNPRGGTLRESLDPNQPAIRIGRKVLKGGSHLCADNYCQRYRPAARHAQMVDSATSHIGFRCIVRPGR